MDLPKKKILIVDDDLSIRFILKKFLGKYIGDFIDIYTSQDGVQGLGYAFILKPDVIIIDSTLPKYSGRELVEFLTTNNKFASVPVILLSESFELLNDLPPSYVQISKKDKKFPIALIDLVANRVNHPTYNQERNTLGFRTVNFLSKKIVEYSNESYIDAEKIKGDNLIAKIINAFGFIFFQIITSFYLTFFFILMGKKDFEENPVQKEKDTWKYRAKIYPSVIIGIGILLFILVQIIIITLGILSVTLFSK